MNQADIAKSRLTQQQIAHTTFKTAQEIAGWMGAMQAQDYPMAKWALGVRMPGSTDSAIENAVNSGDIVRTHLMRPTWHFVSAEDVYWLLALTAPHIKSSLKSRHQELELTPAIFAKSTAILEKALRDSNYLDREELIAELQKAGITTDANRAYHLIFQAELDAIVCNGPIKAGKQTYALLQERIPKPNPIPREEARARLAQKYFNSHGPATLQDFIWWSGLSVNDARQALEAVKTAFITETIDSKNYWFSPTLVMPQPGQDTVYLLPAFDEFLISYRDRSAMLPFQHETKTISSNGIFRPMVVVNGQITGIWKRTVKKEKVLIETQLFNQPDQNILQLIEKAALEYGQFLAKEIKL